MVGAGYRGDGGWTWEIGKTAVFYTRRVMCIDDLGREESRLCDANAGEKSKILRKAVYVVYSIPSNSSKEKNYYNRDRTIKKRGIRGSGDPRRAKD
jgi:hypothetical protein